MKRIFSIIKKLLSGISLIVMAALLVLANTILPSYAGMLNNMIGYNQSVDNSNIDTNGLDLEYYKSDYSEEEIGDKIEELSDQIAAESTVLLKNNEDIMPFEKGTKFSFFSVNSIETRGFLGMSMPTGLKESFMDAGFQINEELWNFYDKDNKYGLGQGSIGFGDDEDFSINEAPLSIIEEEGLLDTAEDTIPVFVLSRVAGEGRDMPRSMYNHTEIVEDQSRTYIEPDSIELEILSYLNENFEDVVLIINSNAALELGWLDNFENISAVLYAPTIDQTLASIFTGEVNPSGRTVDTFAKDALASPAAQNFGSYQYYDEKGEPTKYNYITYAEGIYVGYRYYETRYEDVIKEQGNAGDFDYNHEVVYPFGYGLSYTEFSWENFEFNQEDDIFTATVDVTNTGNVAGKDVVELYMQSPYTDYNKENDMEKSSVELVGFEKTKNLNPGETQTISIEFNKEQLKSYDANGAETYVLDAGEYYFTVGKDSNDAINNILASQGYTKDDGMTDNGKDEMTFIYTTDNIEVDTEIYATDTETGIEITNQFEQATEKTTTYLSRNNWQETFPQPDGSPSEEISTWGNEINGIDSEGNPASYTWMKEASEEILAALESSDSQNPDVIEEEEVDVVYGKDNGLSVIDMRGLDFDDPKWDELLDQLTPEDYNTLIIDSGYGTEPIESIGKPFNLDADTASHLIYGGTGGSYPNSISLASTWNKELANDFGTMIGNEAVLGGAHGWYAPSMNMHRTPFSGRNGEYYSEDPFLSGVIAQNVVAGASSKGLYTFIKHYAVNDQENHRGDRKGQYGLVTWANEQSIREIYLKPFEMAVKAGEVDVEYVGKNDNGQYENKSTTVPASQAVMTAFNRLGTTWTGGSYPLITGVLRNEWGFNGFVITDNANTSVFMDPYQMVESGADAKLLNADDPTDFAYNEKDPLFYHYSRKAIHRMLYTIANSNAMNGAMPGSKFKQGIQPVTYIRSGVNILGVIVFGLFGRLIYKKIKNRKNKVDSSN